MKLMNLGSSLCYLNVATDTFYYRLYDISVELVIYLCFDVVYSVQNHKWIVIEPRWNTDVKQAYRNFVSCSYGKRSLYTCG